jgi:uncharacterized protein (TIGR03437 family)
LASGIASANTTPARSSGSKVIVRDKSGAESEAQSLYVSPGQINLVLPGGLASGPAVLKVMRDGQLAAAAQVLLNPVAPGLFAANGMERGPAAAIIVYVTAGGSQTSATAFECGATTVTCTTVPISIQPEKTTTYLSLYGTGIRGVASKDGVKVSIGGIQVPVLSAGPQSEYAGLDQVNVELPASLAGKGEVPVLLSTDGQNANTVFINVR